MALQWVHFSGNGSVVFAKSTMITTVITTAVWLTTTLLTQPESDDRLVNSIGVYNRRFTVGSESPRLRQRSLQFATLRPMRLIG